MTEERTSFVEHGRITALRHTIANELRERPMAYGVLAVFMIIGPIAAPIVFPGATPAMGVVGGMAFGIYAAVCAVPGKFL